MTGKSLLFEIGTEEIPARFLTEAVFSLKREALRVFNENSIEVSEDNISIYATPRRLTFILRRLPERQTDRVREVFGPPKRIAFTEDGSFTKAGLKFAESQGVAPETLLVKKKDKGEYIVAVIEEKGLPIKEVLPEVLKKIVLSLSFPKSMRWGTGSLRFVRPIRWLCAVLDSEAIYFELDGIKSGNLTRGHRFLSPGPFAVPQAEDYEELLEKHFVMAEPTKRKTEIARQINLLAEASGGKAVEDEELLTTVTHLVEYPRAVPGSFDEKYLFLPEELLITVMKGHQKYFSVKDSEGRLINKFIIISNTRAENDETVQKGAERVIRARFEDARFYYEEDIKKPLIDRLEELKKVTFYEGLGSLYDKAMRIAALSKLIAEKTGVEQAISERAALLSKCDLVSGVVREFPELQGIMGGYYAQNDKESPDIVRALKEQYLFSERDLEGISDTGAVLSLADRIDTIVSFFSIGQKPTGSQDPFALRRNALVVIWILINKKYNISINSLIETVVGENPTLKAEITEFFSTRIEFLLKSDFFRTAYKEYSPDVIESAIRFSTDEAIGNFLSRLDALQSFKSEMFYADFLTAAKRVRNIIPKTAPAPYKEELFRHEAEKELSLVLGSVKQAISECLQRADYSGALREAVRLTAPINRFFDSVMIMDKDEEIKANRLALLADIWDTISKIADLSRLEQ